MPDPKDAEYLDALRDERDSATLYETLSVLESNPKLAEVYRRLAAVERRHADTWVQRLRETGAPVPEYRVSARTRMLIWLWAALRDRVYCRA
jgi:rubrerythrin